MKMFNSASVYGGRMALKLMQFFVSVYLIFALYNIGPHWILLVACLAIPLYGIYLLMKSPDRTLKHPLPYIRYKALIRARGWLRVDLSICVTMAVVCFGFGLVLFAGFFMETHSVNMFLLQAASASLILGILYAFNAFVMIKQLQSGTIDFPNGGVQLATTRASRTSPHAGQTLAVDTASSNQILSPEEHSGATARALDTRQSSWSSPNIRSTTDSAKTTGPISPAAAAAATVGVAERQQQQQFLASLEEGENADEPSLAGPFPLSPDERASVVKRRVEEQRRYWSSSRETFERRWTEEELVGSEGDDVRSKLNDLKEGNRLVQQQQRPAPKRAFHGTSSNETFGTTASDTTDSSTSAAQRISTNLTNNSFSQQERGVDVIKESGINYCIIVRNDRKSNDAEANGEQKFEGQDPQQQKQRFNQQTAKQNLRERNILHKMDQEHFSTATGRTTSPTPIVVEKGHQHYYQKIEIGSPPFPEQLPNGFAELNSRRLRSADRQIKHAQQEHKNQRGQKTKAGGASVHPTKFQQSLSSNEERVSANEAEIRPQLSNSTTTDDGGSAGDQQQQRRDEAEEVGEARLLYQRFEAETRRLAKASDVSENEGRRSSDLHHQHHSHQSSAEANISSNKWKNLMMSPVKVKPWVTTVSQLPTTSNESGGEGGGRGAATSIVTEQKKRKGEDTTTTFYRKAPAAV